MPTFDLLYRTILGEVENVENLNTLANLRSSRKNTAIELNSPLLDSISLSDIFIPSQNGAPNIRIRMYKPIEMNKTLPGVLWIHGGGYFIGCPEADDNLCQRFVMEANCVVASVDYRLAPENPFPAAIEDCYTSLKWFSDSAEELGVDTARIAVAGASAGGGLTAALSLLARDRNGPSITFQMPLYPMIDDRNITQSSNEIKDRRVWNNEVNRLAWAAYLGDNHDFEVSPYAAPSRSTDLSGLPPTYTCVGDLDPFRDETIEYVARLTKAGVPTEFHLYPGCFHGFDLVAPTEVSENAVTQYVKALKFSLHR